MNATMKADAVDYLLKAWNSHSSNQSRVQAFAERFRAAYPNYFWYAVYNYNNLARVTQQYIKMRVNKKDIYVFSVKL